MEDQIKHFSDIITAAAKSPWGVFALMLLLISLMGVVFFKDASEYIRIGVWIPMFLGVVSVGVALFRARSLNEISAQKETSPALPDQPDKEIENSKALEEPAVKNKLYDTTESSQTLQNIESYLTWLCENYAHMDADKLHGKGHAVPLSLPEIFIPLYANDPEQKKGAKSGDRMPDERQQPVDIEMLIAKNDYLLIEGHAGSGKTTVLKHLTYCLAQQEMDNPHIAQIKDFLPVFILLKDVKDFFHEKENSKSVNAENIMTWYFSSKMDGIIDFSTIKGFIKSKKIIFLLDGLDEILPAHRDAVVNTFADLRIKNKGIKVVFSGRPHGITGVAVNRFGKNHVNILNLNMAQIKAFIKKWFGYLYSQSAGAGRKNADAMIGEIKDHPGVEILIDNPLMLTAICILYYDGRELPGQRAELYKKFIDNLLYRRFDDPELIHDYLRSLAFKMHTAKKRAVDKTFAVDVLKEIYKIKPDETEHDHSKRVERMFDDTEPKCGLLKFENGQFNFWHLTFQEFLAADYIKDNHSDQVKAIEPYWGEDGYNEMIELYIGFLSIDNKKTANDIVDAALTKEDKAPFMRFRVAAHALLDIHKNRRSPEVMEKARQRMMELINTPDSPEVWMDAGEIIGWLDDPGDLKAFIKINGGEYNLEEIGTVTLKPFEISKYPMTNKWFEEFMDVGGYENRAFWSDEGRKWLEHTKVTQPRLWDERKWKCPNAPVVGVCWYEADAFTRWLTSLNDGYTYRLLSEKEWQAAAAGKSGREYPWIGGWDKNKCNNRELKIEKISPVGIFTQGETPEGISDLAGNVWEWTLTDYHAGQDRVDFQFDAGVQVLWDDYVTTRDEKKWDKYYSKIMEKDRLLPALRGGGWINDSDDCRCAARDRDYPDNRDDDIGFRCART